MELKLQKIEGLCTNISFCVMGALENNIYFICDGETHIIVDPTAQAKELVSLLNGAPLDYILVTHAHADHVGAAYELRELTGAQVVSSAPEKAEIEKGAGVDPYNKANACPVDIAVADGEFFEAGTMKWQCLVTPGHTPGSTCWLLLPEYGCNKNGAPVLLSGDTLFKGTTGRTDFEGGSAQAMQESMQRLSKLDANIKVFPGHYAFSSIAEEAPLFARFA